MRYPISLWLEVESRCNLACRFCYNPWRGGREAYPRLLETSALLAGLDALFERFECRRVAVSGGEPLLRPDLDEMLVYLSNRRQNVVITTNGALLTGGRADHLAAIGVDTLQVSLHSSNEHDHNWLSAGAAFRPALAALMLARERGINTVAVFVATKRNLANFPDTLRLLAKIDVRRIIFNRFIVSGLGYIFQNDLGVPNDEDTLRMLGDAHSVAADAGQTIFLGTPLHADAETRQRLPSIRFASCPVRQQQTRWTIGADGELRRCNHSLASIGNIVEDGIEKLTQLYAASAHVSRDGAGCNDCQLRSGIFDATSPGGARDLVGPTSV